MVPLRVRWLAAGLWACVLPFTGLGCVASSVLLTSDEPPLLHRTTYRSADQKEPDKKEPDKKKDDPAPPAPQGSEARALIGAPPAGLQPVQVGLDTVFRLAEAQNPRIALAREKVREVCLEADAKATQPSQPTGLAGLLARLSGKSALLAKRDAAVAKVTRVRQRTEACGKKVEITQEVLLDAASTYIDLVTARRAEVILRDAERLQVEMLQRAEALDDEKVALAKLLVGSARGDVTTSQQMLVQVHKDGNAAAAKLAYLLGLGSNAEPVPFDADAVPLHLVDLSPPLDHLVARVQLAGPGVREVEELICAISEGIKEAEPLLKYLPEEEAKQKRAAAQNKLCQAELTLAELKNKLTLGVREGRETVLASQARFRIATEQIQALADLFRLTREAVLENVAATKLTDVLGTIRSLRDAHLAHLRAVQDHNKAQVRLLLLLGR